jgi:hypothetical protein
MNTKAKAYQACATYGEYANRGRPLSVKDRIEAKRRPLPPIRPLKVAPVTPLMLPLVELKSHQCHYPINDGGLFLFCGNKKMEGRTPYCELHHRLCHQPPE